MSNSKSTCDLCGSTRASYVYHLDGYDIMRCKQCSLVYRYTMPTDQQLFDMYNTLPTIAESQIVAYYRDFRRETYQRMFQTLDQITTQTNQIPLTFLDAGAGRGWSYSVAREFGYRPFGLDLGFQECAHARTEGPTLQASTEYIPLSSASLDVVLMSDVLEHVRDPRLILGEVKRVLKSNGYVILRVPNVSGLLIRAFDLASKLTAGRFNKPGRMLYRLHLYGFSESTLSQYLSETGFQVACFYLENSKNPSELGQKDWAKNPLIRLGIVTLVRLGDLIGRQDEIVMIAQSQDK